MSDQILKDWTGRKIGTIRPFGKDLRVYDISGKYLGFYRASLDRTFYYNGSPFGSGNQLVSLIALKK